VERRHICAAAQANHEVRDRAAAEAFFHEHDVTPGDVLCFTGVAGGYSIVNVRLHDDELGILTGSVPADGHPSGQALLDEFVRTHPWVGRRLFGGARAIPLRRPFARLGAGRVALLGDAGCQVFSAHGSGIAQGLLAARRLADTLAEDGTPADYGRSFLRAHGGLLASYDLFRRFSQTLDVQDLERMMRAGLLDGETAAAGMAQRFPAPSPGALVQKARGLPRAPDVALRLGGVLAKMGVLTALYRTWPDDDAGAREYSRRVARVFGEPADPT
jgi:flavin-dependent dehydrogenase